MTDKFSVAQYASPEDQYHDLSSARVIIIPVPFAYEPNGMHASQAILNASSHLELYDEELECCPIEIGIHTYPIPDYDGLNEITILNLTSNIVIQILQRGLFPITIGCEYPPITPNTAIIHKLFPKLTTVHVGAHSQLHYESFFSAQKGDQNVDMENSSIELGLREVSSQEALLLKAKSNLTVIWGKQLIDGTVAIPWERFGTHTYLTVDLDIFDPSEMPAVRVSKPGGLRWYKILELFREICLHTTVVGMDVIGLYPLKEQVAADFLAAKLIYKMIGYRFYQPIKNRLKCVTS